MARADIFPLLSPGLLGINDQGDPTGYPGRQTCRSIWRGCLRSEDARDQGNPGLDQAQKGHDPTDEEIAPQRCLVIECLAWIDYPEISLFARDRLK
jgi:hypothetical protein